MVLLNPKWPQLICHVWLGELEVAQGLLVHITIHHDTMTIVKLEFVKVT
jgi:hypothetical protein